MLELGRNQADFYPVSHLGDRKKKGAVMSSAVRRVLIADDHEIVIQGIRGLMESRPNFQIVAAVQDGWAAVEAARSTQPDIAIVDYLMPGLNGVDLTRELKQEFPRLEVLLYTMCERETVLLEAMRAGARGCVLKSSGESDLLAALDALSVGRTYLSGNLSQRLLERALDTQSAGHGTITRREREVVQLISEGKINKQIAGILGITAKTVETHRASAMHKLQLNTTAQLVRYALRNELLQA